MSEGSGYKDLSSLDSSLSITYSYPSLSSLRHQAPLDSISSAESKVVSSLEKNVGELFEKGYRRADVVDCMDRFLNDLQSDGVDFRGSKIVLDSNGDLVGQSDCHTIYSRYHVFDDYAKRGLESIDSKISDCASYVAGGITSAIKGTYDSIDSTIFEPIDDYVVAPILDGVAGIVKYALDAADRALDECLIVFGIGSRCAYNSPSLAYAGACGNGSCDIPQEIEDYWDGKNLVEHLPNDEDSFADKVVNFFSNLFG